MRLMSVPARWAALAVLTLSSSALADWNFAVSCPAKGVGSGAFSLAKDSGSSFGAGGTCTRTTSKYTRFTIDSYDPGFGPGDVQTTSFTAVHTGDLMISTPMLSGEELPIFTMATDEPTDGVRVNWIVAKWNNNGIVPVLDNYLIGSATIWPSIPTNGQGIKIHSMYDAEGTSYFQGEMPIAGNWANSPDLGIYNALPTNYGNLKGKGYFSDVSSGYFESTRGRASMFFPKQTISAGQFANRTYTGITFDSTDLTGSDQQYAIRVEGSPDPGVAARFIIRPFSDVDDGLPMASTNSEYFEDDVQIPLNRINYPEKGMMVGTVDRLKRNGAGWIMGQGKIACIVNSDGLRGTRVICSGQDPINNERPYNFSFTHFHYPTTLDETIGNAGRVSTTVQTYSNAATAIAVQPDNKVIVLGNAYEYTTFWEGDCIMARFNEDGTLDAANFSNGGKMAIDFNTIGNDSCWDMSLLSDGKWLVGGNRDNKANASDPGLYTAAVSRRKTNGDKDGVLFGSNKFGTATAHGLFLFSMADSSVHQTWLNALEVKPDGKILIAGWIKKTSDVNDKKKALVAQLTSAGKLDKSNFGAGKGYVEIEFEYITNSESEAFDVHYDASTTKIHVAGTIKPSGLAYRGGWARLSSDGTIEDFDDVHQPNSIKFRRVFIDPYRPGEVARVGGGTHVFLDNFKNTTINETYGQELDQTAATPSDHTAILGLVIQPDNRILVSGRTADGKTYVRRYFKNCFVGSDLCMDNSFGANDVYNNGYAEVESTSIGVGSSGTDIAVGPDGAIYVTLDFGYAKMWP